MHFQKKTSYKDCPIKDNKELSYHAFLLPKTEVGNRHRKIVLCINHMIFSFLR